MKMAKENIQKRCENRKRKHSENIWKCKKKNIQKTYVKMAKKKNIWKTYGKENIQKTYGNAEENIQKTYENTEKKHSENIQKHKEHRQTS